MSDSSPVVSIIIPTYYRNDFVSAAIESVYSQPYRPIELVIVDDSGEGHAKPVIEEYEEITCVPLDENRGQNAALNRGLEHVNGDYVQFLDDDDKIMDGKLTKQVACLESEDDVGVAYCRLRHDSGEITDPSPNGTGEVLKEALMYRLSSCVTSTMLFDRETLSEITPLPTPPGSTDTFMKIELAQCTEFAFVDVVGIYKRDHPEAVSRSKGAVEGTKQIFDRYEELYRQYPSEIRGVALSKYYNRAGEYHVYENDYSLVGIASFAKAVYHDPQIPLSNLARLSGSIFGRPGLSFVDWCLDAIARSMES